MCTTVPSRADFISQVLTSSFADQQAKRFAFADGEVGAVYTLSRKLPAAVAPPVVLLVAVFPPGYSADGVHDFGIDYYEQPVSGAEQAAQLLASFDQTQAAAFRRRCRPLIPLHPVA